MIQSHRDHIAILLSGYFAARPTQSVADWCCECLHFNEPGNRGPYSLAGREYLRESLNDWADQTITDQVEVFGSQSGKTGSIMGGASWTIANEPSRLFWVMPTRETARGFSRTRWVAMLRASPIMAALIPAGAARHEFSTFQQRVGNSIVDLVWSNSPAALASVPARVVILDEVDKFNEGGAREANAVDLADQRTKSFANPKKVKTSTPTLIQGLIWQEFLKTDQRRRWLPCPHCKKFFILVWSKSFTVFKLTGAEAEIRWDKEAKRPDGSWDLDRVERSTRAECPHCQGHVLDAHKTWMDRNGEWRPSAVAARGYRGRHLPSLYAASAQTNFGRLAVKFLQAKQSLLGLQGFINGDLAEPFESQDRQTERVEIITSRLEVTDEWQKIETVDCQATQPYYYYVIRAHSQGKSHGIDAGYLDTIEEVRAKQLSHGIRDDRLIIDSGYGAHSDDGVYANCARFSKMIKRRDRLPFCLGWTPSKGLPGRKRWKNRTGQMVPYFMQAIDPFVGTSKAGLVQMELFEFSTDYFKDILEAARQRKAGYEWSVDQAVATAEFWRHMDGEIKIAVLNKMTGRASFVWRPRSPHWPNHWFDCEVLQVAYAAYLGIIKPE